MSIRKKLSAFSKGESGRVVTIRTDSLKVLLLGLGLAEGDKFTLSDIAPLGDPIAIRTASTKIAIRKNDAEQILAEVLA